MTAVRRRIGIAAFAASLLGCGCSLNQPGANGSGACAAKTACECLAARDFCESRTEACWCPSECDPNSACTCGGGRFLACEEAGAAWTRCDRQATRVTSLCAGTEFVGSVYGLCVSNPNCTAQCLSALTTTQSCAQIDCSFCDVGCDCLLPAMPSAFRTCLIGCWAGANP